MKTTCESRKSVCEGDDCDGEPVVKRSKPSSCESVNEHECEFANSDEELREDHDHDVGAGGAKKTKESMNVVTYSKLPKSRHINCYRCGGM